MHPPRAATGSTWETPRLTPYASPKKLLLKILETHPQLTVDTTAVSAAWPDGRERPSARAITERLVRIRKNAGVHFAVRSAQRSGSSNGVKSAPTTPQKPHAAVGQNGITPRSDGGGGDGGESLSGSGGGKRKRNTTTKIKSDKDDDEDDDSLVVISPREVASLQSRRFPGDRPPSPPTPPSTNDKHLHPPYARSSTPPSPLSTTKRKHTCSTTSSSNTNTTKRPRLFDDIPGFENFLQEEDYDDDDDDDDDDVHQDESVDENEVSEYEEKESG